MIRVPLCARVMSRVSVPCVSRAGLPGLPPVSPVTFKYGTGKKTPGGAGTYRLRCFLANGQG